VRHGVHPRDAGPLGMFVRFDKKGKRKGHEGVEEINLAGKKDRTKVIRRDCGEPQRSPTGAQKKRLGKKVFKKRPTRIRSGWRENGLKRLRYKMGLISLNKWTSTDGRDEHNKQEEKEEKSRTWSLYGHPRSLIGQRRVKGGEQPKSAA